MKVNIGICQMKVSSSRDENLNNAKRHILEVKSKNADIAVLPEMFTNAYDTSTFIKYAQEEKSSDTLKLLRAVARENDIYIVGGSVPEKAGNRIYNTCYVIDNKGEIIAKHRKMHLFDVDIEGSMVFKESDSLKSGNKMTVVETEFAKIGICICYDIRFAELSRLMVLDGADIIIVPAAFNMTTGPLHWELLFRARAVDNQAFMVGVSPSRNEKDSYVAYGNSLVVNPWGKVLYNAGIDECNSVVTIDTNEIDDVRNQIPILKHRRKDMYELNLIEYRK